MKNLNNYINESIFDMSDDEITDKPTIDVTINYMFETERYFKALSTINEESLKKVLYNVVLYFNDKHITFGVFDLGKSPYGEYVQVKVINSDDTRISKNRLCAIVYRNFKHEPETWKVTPYNITDKQRDELQKIIDDYNEEHK